MFVTCLDHCRSAPGLVARLVREFLLWHVEKVRVCTYLVVGLIVLP